MIQGKMSAGAQLVTAARMSPRRLAPMNSECTHPHGLRTKMCKPCSAILNARLATAARWAATPAERFWAKVNKTESCWLWSGPKMRNGYGYFHESPIRRHASAHRFSYELAHGSIPAGLQIDHLCRVALCVNPSHLEAVTSRENTMRGLNFAAANARKTHCTYGHEFTEANTYRDRQRRRYCRMCILRRSRARFLVPPGDPAADGTPRRLVPCVLP